MKTILCYGDSNTFGFIPKTAGRYDHKTRWPGALRRLLNEGCPADEPAWWVVEEGLNGRTTCREDFIELGRNGLTPVVTILKSHKPLDIVAVMLGTNDLKRRFLPSAYDTAQGALNLIKAIQNSETGPGDGAPKVLLICPPPLVEAKERFFDDLFDGALEISKKLSPYYREIALESGAAFLDAGSIVQSSPLDGVHLSPESHAKLAAAVKDSIMKMS
jgi:lysophospholipase L1-like esterase